MKQLVGIGGVIQTFTQMQLVSMTCDRLPVSIELNVIFV